MLRNEENARKVATVAEALREIEREIAKRIVGQKDLVRQLVIALLSGGHVLIEGAPGLAKTLTVQTLASALELSFHRISFTPDLLPLDLIGSEVYHPGRGDFSQRRGPVFTNVLLADEINRAPAKVQSALLEAMQEGRVTIGDTTYDLPKPFFVLATQNPIEQEGTYALPEAELDRFAMKLLVGYPTAEEELEILRLPLDADKVPVLPVLSEETLAVASAVVAKSVYVDDRILEYVRDIVLATRAPAEAGLPHLVQDIEYGVSPRASIALLRASKVLACFNGRDYVLPEDIKTLAYPVLRHRL